LRAYLADRQVSYVEDETNEDVSIPRNRVRVELIPMLANRFNPAIVNVLAHEAELLREAWTWLQSAAADFENGVGKGVSGVSWDTTPAPVLELDAARLKAAPPPLRRLALWRAMSEASGGRPVGFRHVEAALQLLDANGGGIDAPGHRVERVGASLVLTRRGLGFKVRRPAEANLFEYPLSIPGEVRLTEAGCLVAAELPTDYGGTEAAARSGRGALAVVRRDLCRPPLAVRNRRPGDRFRPIGLGGQKKLQDYFVDRKVALGRRDRIPLVVDQADRIVWVAGYGIDEMFRVTDPSQSVLLLRLRQV
jgi:tRNA(Ile)-lysidine synthase